MKKRKTYTYAAELTKEYLMKLGITDVTPDGLHIYKGSEELAQYIPKAKDVKRRYFRVNLYDPELRQATPKEERTKNTGRIIIPAHVINYVWNRGPRKLGLIIDHLDNNPLNNHIDNLQLISQRENVIKDRKASIRELKCKLDRPLSYYEDKLSYYEDLYQKAVKDGDQEEAHKQRGNIYGQRARIRYWLSHKEEAEALIAKKQAYLETKLSHKKEVEALRAKKQAYLETKLDSDVYHAKAEVIKLLRENISKRRAEYNNALEANGSEHEATLSLKAEWKRAVKELNDFVWAASGSDKSHLPELINTYAKRALLNF